MSRFLTTLRFTIAAMVLLCAAGTRVAAQDYNDGYGQGSYQQFYDDLSPYGQWVNDPQYGYVWVPDAGSDFRPYYSDGYWANTEYGNTWVSNYRWGWAPFHYGRWTYSDYYGWTWIPGNEWGPAWVSWRSGGGAYGWAPLGPGISISASFGSGYYAPDNWWTFTPQQYILNRNFHQHSYGPRYNSNYIHQTTIINNTYVNNHNTYIAGPRRNELERATGRPVNVVSINNSTRPDRAQLQGNSLSMYRPAITESRPRVTERPREFRDAQQPIAPSPRDAAIRPDRNTAIRPSAVQPQSGMPGSAVNANNNAVLQQQGSRSFNRPRQEDMRQPVQSVQPIQTPQPQRTPRNWNSSTAVPDRAPAQRAPDPAPFNRDIQQPRAMQPQQQMPQRAERAPISAQPQSQVPAQQRMEAPRPMPQREAPTAAPARIGTMQQGNSGSVERPFRR